MSKYDSYFLMKAEEVSDYVQEKLSYFDADAKLNVRRSETGT